MTHDKDPERNGKESTCGHAPETSGCGCSHENCSGPDGAETALPDAVLAKALEALKPILPEGLQQAEISFAVAPGGKVSMEGFYTIGGEVHDLDLDPVGEALAGIFQEYPEQLMAGGYGPSNVYTVFIEPGQEPAIEHSHDIAYGGRMSVQEISEELEDGLMGFLPEKWEKAWIRLGLDENDEGEYSGGYLADEKEYDITEELYAHMDRLDALLNELRVAPDVPEEGWNMAEFTLEEPGQGELVLLDVEYEDDPEEDEEDEMPQQ